LANVAAETSAWRVRVRVRVGVRRWMGTLQRQVRGACHATHVTTGIGGAGSSEEAWGVVHAVAVGLFTFPLAGGSLGRRRCFGRSPTARASLHARRRIARLQR
jgi:hypothetical protein